MPTVPEPHEIREVAESFGVNAERYDRARPAYPAALIERLASGQDVLDVGCGTGIVARQLRAAGCRVLGVDVDERMAEQARRGGLEVEVSTFEAWDPGPRTFDTVVAGQTWHWIDPVAGAAKAAHVLRPGGRLAVFWNVFRPAPALAEALAAVYRRVVPDAPLQPWARPPLEAYRAIIARAADGIRDTGAFGEPEQWRFDWERSYTREEWLEQVSTGGDVSRLASGTLDELLTGVGDAVDALGGPFTMRYAAVAVTA